MTRTKILFLFLLLFTAVIFAQAKDEKQQINTAKGVLERTIGKQADVFTFKMIPSENGFDVFEVSAINGKVEVSGSSVIAMAHGAYEYLRQACHFEVTWTSSKVPIPKVFPDFQISKTSTPYKFRLYYNVCTYGYTTAFWGWDEWQKELDWMALHGINMPLAMIGQEAIWQKVWKSYGITDKDLAEYFTGPAFLPWHRMGNVNKHDGPLPQSYIDKSITLQKQLLERMKLLGMTPVVPAFSGYVPNAIKRVLPDAKIIDMKDWAGFKGEYGTHLLSPISPYFKEIGKKFIEEYRKEFGECKYYLADVFNEMDVPVTKEGRYKELSDFGSAVFNSINAADPSGVWVMQGWLFYNSRNFWDKPSAQAFLKDVPNDRMIIIDLATESFKGWQSHDNFYGKEWINSIIHNYGGNSSLFGNLETYAKIPGEMLAANYGNMVGFGISPEGINQNEVVYELLTDLIWTNKAIDVNTWIESYCKFRYGSCPPEMKEAWDYLIKGTYSEPVFPGQFVYQSVPGTKVSANLDNMENYNKAVELFAACSKYFSKSPLYLNDLVEITAQYAGCRADYLIAKGMDFLNKGNSKEADKLFNTAFSLLKQVDALLNTIPERRIETWINFAKKWAKDTKEAEYYEMDAKRQITVWGGPDLTEYACKVWSGLIRDYYIPRWQTFIKSVETKLNTDMRAWEEKWISTPNDVSKPEKVNDVISYAKKLIKNSENAVAGYMNYIAIKSDKKSPNEFIVTLSSKRKDLKISYCINEKYIDYLKPISVKAPCTLNVQTMLNGKIFGSPLKMDFALSLNKPVKLLIQPSDKYKAGGSATINDGIFGTEDYKSHWLGFNGDDFSAIIDLEKTFPINSIAISYLSLPGSWIFQPVEFKVEVSDDGINFTPADLTKLDASNWKAVEGTGNYSHNFNGVFGRYIKATAKNRGVCPPGHTGAGNKSWIFIDEVTVK